ncbi:MAG: hypothetical protein ACLQPD_04455 [Desulfomonilaceae bacterium]
MKARIVKSLIDTGGAARDFIRLVRGRKQSCVKSSAENKKGNGASGVLEAFRIHSKADEPQYILTGKNVLRAMDEQMTELCVPFEYSVAAREVGRGIIKGSLVMIPGDDRVFEVVKVWYEYESIRIGDPEDPNGVQYVLPWNMVRLLDQNGVS